MPSVKFIHGLRMCLVAWGMMLKWNKEGVEIAIPSTELKGGAADVHELIALVRIVQEIMNQHHVLLEEMNTSPDYGCTIFHAFKQAERADRRERLRLVWAIHDGSPSSLSMEVYLEDQSVHPSLNAVVCYKAAEKLWWSNSREMKDHPMFFRFVGDLPDDGLTREGALTLVENMVSFFAHSDTSGLANAN